jgi:hypothetical protein
VVRLACFRFAAVASALPLCLPLLLLPGFAAVLCCRLGCPVVCFFAWRVCFVWLVLSRLCLLLGSSLSVVSSLSFLALLLCPGPLPLVRRLVSLSRRPLAFCLMQPSSIQLGRFGVTLRTRCFNRRCSVLIYSYFTIIRRRLVSYKVLPSIKICGIDLELRCLNESFVAHHQPEL